MSKIIASKLREQKYILMQTSEAEKTSKRPKKTRIVDNEKATQILPAPIIGWTTKLLLPIS
jgi:hypothetical protein